MISNFYGPHFMQTPSAANTPQSQLLQIPLPESGNPLISIRRAGLHPLALRVGLLFIAICVLFPSNRAASAQASYSFPSVVTVGGTPQVQSVPVNVQTAGVLGSVEVLTLGTPNLDFTLTPAQPCAMGSYTVNQTCTVSVQFAPSYPGARRGAIVLLDTSGKIMATQTLYGIGQGPLSVMEASFSVMFPV